MNTKTNEDHRNKRGRDIKEKFSIKKPTNTKWMKQKITEFLDLYKYIIINIIYI